MRYKSIITVLVLCIVFFSVVATTIGIFSNGGPGNYEYMSVHGESILLYGRGIYKHMSITTAPQGIAQDYVTLLLGVPLLISSLFYTRKGSMSGRILLTGTLGYFLVTYFFYLVMAMYNELFLVYVVLTLCSFYSFILCLISFDLSRLSNMFKSNIPETFIGGFLIFNSTAIGLMWLSRIVPPLLKGAYPTELEHYTTLIVQGLDLAILLPAGILAGVLLIRKCKFGYLLATTYIIFLSILMTALVGKIIGQVLVGVEVGAVMLIIPTINIISWACVGFILRKIKDKKVLENRV